MSEKPSREAVVVPKRVLWLFRGFLRYVKRFVRKNFHAVRLSKTSSPWPTGPEPIIVVMNHPSWWDPMIGTMLLMELPHGEHYGAIDAEAIQKYPIFQKLGFLPVDTKSLRGAAEFLRLAGAVLEAPNRFLWITAQGEFADVRKRPLDLRSGVGHVAARVPTARIVPVALEYSFWTEKTPEALVRIGETLHVVDHPTFKGKDWTAKIEEALTANLDQLNRETMSRDPGQFTLLTGGKTGVGGLYDLWRRVTFWARGKKFNPSHEG
ncbi:MAG: lysophospholipid acyltransferase family protein [Fimbriiglobus sp.]